MKHTGIVASHWNLFSANANTFQHACTFHHMGIKTMYFFFSHMKFTLINYCWEVNGLTVTIKDKITKKQWPLLKEHMTLSQEIKPKQLPFIRLSAINTVYLSTWLMKETKKKDKLQRRKNYHSMIHQREVNANLLEVSPISLFFPTVIHKAV